MAEPFHLNDIWIPLWGVVLGGLITWLAARVYYIAASKKLKNEAKELRRLSGWIIRLLIEGTDNLTVKSNEEGEVIGLNLTIKCDPVKLTMKGQVGQVTVTTGGKSS